MKFNPIALLPLAFLLIVVAPIRNFVAAQDQSGRAAILEGTTHHPLSLERNVGQAPSRGPGYDLSLPGNKGVLSLFQPGDLQSGFVGGRLMVRSPSSER